MLETDSGLDNQVLLLSRQFCAAAAGPSLGQPMGPGIGRRTCLSLLLSLHTEPFITLNKSSKPGGGNSYACAKMK